MNQSIGFIGGGRVVKIILQGWKRAERFPAKIMVTDSNAEILGNLKNEFQTIETSTNNTSIPAASDIVFIALHPPVLMDALKEIKFVVKPSTIIISLAPKIPTSKISEALGGLKNVARIIPNAPSIANAGYNPVAFSTKISDEARMTINELFKPLGELPEVQEELLEAYAIFTGMGPTYFWFQLYEFQEIIKSFGISREAIKNGLPRMLDGALKTMYETGLGPAEVMDLVPVKPLGEDEAEIRRMYQTRLNAIYMKLKG